MASRYQSNLPRSVRWRIDLGLLQQNDDNQQWRNNFGRQDEIGGYYGDDGDDGTTMITLSSIQTGNQQLITSQRKQYDVLADKHYRNSSAIEIIHDTDHVVVSSSSAVSHTISKGAKNIDQTKVAPPTSLQVVGTKGGLNANAKSEDPLSVFAQIEELKVKSEKEKEMEIKKERALAARTQYSAAQQYQNQNYDQTLKHIKSKPSSSASGESGNNNSSKGQNRWSEFYSSREVMDIIEKDVDRLPTEHQVAAFYAKITPNEIKREENYIFDLDKQLKRMNQLIQKEESSSPTPTPSTQSNHYDEILKSCRKERSHAITQILFVYAKQYPKLGYRQGMHEILSLIYLCLEIDLLFTTKHHHSTQQQQGQKFEELLLEPSKMAHDAFTIFQTIMSLLCPAYEVRSVENNTSSKNTFSTSPMELIGKQTIDKIRVMASDEELFQFIQSMTIPPELYCTRWIRLMFSRDVKGLSNVMILWDEFFHLISKQSTTHGEEEEEIVNEKQSETESSTSRLMNILEITAASMIIMIRPKLIPNVQHMGYQEEDDENDPNDCIHMLMNYDPIEDVANLVKVIDDMISGKINAPSKSPQITMSVGDDTQVQEDYVSNNQYQIQGDYSMDQSHMMPTQQAPPMPYGAAPHNAPNQMTYGHDPNYQSTTPYYNQPHAVSQDMTYPNSNPHEGPIMYASTGGDFSQYTYVPQQQQYQSNDPIRSTIENIAGNDAWKKLSGGLSEGLNVVKGAIGTLDYSIQHLTTGNNILSSTSVPYASSSHGTRSNPHGNVYNPGLRETNPLPQNQNDPMQRIGDNATYQNNPLMNEQYNGPESTFNPGYRDVKNQVFEPIEPVQTTPYSTGTIATLEPQHHGQNTLQQTNMKAKPIDNASHNHHNYENIIVSVEDQFVGGGDNVGNVGNGTMDEASVLADKLEASLLKLSSYLQNQMKQPGMDVNSIPKSVWDAMAEIEAVKNDLKMKYEVSEKES